MGPHPAVAEVRRAVRAALTTPRVLVACSGGPDSLALAAAVAFEAPRAGVCAGLVTVDHGLWPGSAAQAARVAAVGYELGLDPVLTLPVHVSGSGGPEAAARSARYAALSSAADALDAAVLLGHTLDDQAETVLLGLGRGSGPRSIAGMRPVDGRYHRPFLGVRRAVTVAAVTALGLEAWDDPANHDPAYQRARLRHEVLPVLEDVLQGGVTAALARTADQLRDLLDSVVIKHEWGPGHPTLLDHDEVMGAELDVTELDVAGLVAQPRAVRTRALREWAHAAGARPLSAAHTAELDRLVTAWHGQGPIDLPGRMRVRRISTPDGSARLQAQPSSPSPQSFPEEPFRQ